MYVESIDESLNMVGIVGDDIKAIIPRDEASSVVGDDGLVDEKHIINKKGKVIHSCIKDIIQNNDKIELILSKKILELKTMDKSEYFKKIWANGKLITGYSDLKIFEKQTAIVFARINTEFNYAVGHKYLINNYCFAYDIQEIAESVALTVVEVNIAIQQLEHLNLIKTMVIKSFTLIHLNLENICNFIKLIN